MKWAADDRPRLVSRSADAPLIARPRGGSPRLLHRRLRDRRGAAEIARSPDVSVGTAGQLGTVFSVTVAVAAPLAAVATARAPRRTVLVSAALVFTAANAGAAVSPAFPVLMALRIVAALAAATATPALFATVARLAPPEGAGRAVAAVAFGVTGAIAFGVPAGAWIGGMSGWRATFALMASAGALVAFGFAAALPRTAAEQKVLPVRDQLAVLGRPAISPGLAANVVLMFGSMMLLTYLAPFAAALADASVTDRGLLFTCSGWRAWSASGRVDAPPTPGAPTAPASSESGRFSRRWRRWWFCGRCVRCRWYWCSPSSRCGEARRSGTSRPSSPGCSCWPDRWPHRRWPSTPPAPTSASPSAEQQEAPSSKPQASLHDTTRTTALPTLRPKHRRQRHA